MSIFEHEYPALRQEHIHSARLFADRKSMIKELPIPRNGIIGEVGVAFGDFSKYLIDELRPYEFVAFDTFDLHTLECVWGRPTVETFGGKTHRQFYEATMKEYPQLITKEGQSVDCLRQYPDEYFDMLYIDGDHSFAGVRADAGVALRKLHSNGILIFNDYIIWDHINSSLYGIVPVVNDLVVNQGWKIVGYALEHQLYCDIAIQLIS